MSAGSIVGLGHQGKRAVQTLLVPNFIPLVLGIGKSMHSCDADALIMVRLALLVHVAPSLCDGPVPYVATLESFSRKRLSNKNSNVPPNMASKASKGQGQVGSPPLSEIFSKSGGETEDPFCIFSESSENVAFAHKWIADYVSSLKSSKMHPMTPEGAYHQVESTAARPDPYHATGSSSHSKYQEIFPSYITDDAKYRKYATQLQHAYDYNEGLNAFGLAHDVFGQDSQPFTYRVDDISSVFI